ncbi:MAG: hypothetical protein ACRDQ7_21400, partial [Haloechinothrix sp.]
MLGERVTGPRVAVAVGSDIVDRATGAAVLGDPLEALAQAANALAGRGIALEPGWVLLIGGLTGAMPVEPGHRKTLAARTGIGQVVVPTTYAGSEATPVLGETTDAGKTTG